MAGFSLFRTLTKPASVCDRRHHCSRLIGMHNVDIKPLKNRPSKYIRAASAGEIALIVDRGRVVAGLVSPRVRVETPPGQRDLGDLLQRGFSLRLNPR